MGGGEGFPARGGTRLSARRWWLAVGLACALWAWAPPEAADAGPAPGLEPGPGACGPAAGVPELGPRVCRTAEAAREVGGRLCREAGAGPTGACDRLHPVPVVAERVAAYEASWVHRALALQRRLELDVPLGEVLVPGTHNSYNAYAYAPTLSGLDANQWYGLRDQLRMDVRALELDLHWVPSPHGDPGQAGRAPVVCHGQSVPVGPVAVHAGCTLEVHLRERLAEVRAWLDAHPGEFLLIYLENQLDGDPAAHDAAVAAIAATLGERVYRPPAGSPCAPLPVHASRRQLLAAGAQVLLVGDCGPGGWGAWVHARAPYWLESKSGPGDDYAGLADCAGERRARGYGRRYVRYFEDETWLAAMAGSRGQLTAAEVRAMVVCGVNLLGLDRIHPDDPRLEALVWSWAPGEPAALGAACAVQGPDGRFRARPCGERHRYACRGPEGWHVTRVAGPWSAGFAACARAVPGAPSPCPARATRTGGCGRCTRVPPVPCGSATRTGTATGTGSRPDPRGGGRRAGVEGCRRAAWARGRAERRECRWRRTCPPACGRWW